MKKTIQPATRIFSLISALALVAALFLPLWRIELSAPQYPEGLALVIWPNKLAGDVDVINGLNHYIGMRTLHHEDFIEFQLLPYFIGTLALFGFISFWSRRRSIFTAWAITFIIFGIIAMFDFYRWEFNYGHQLDPTAPIKVPGMSYQPPLIGYKQLLNFGAFSIPDAGGWIFILVGLLLVSGLYLEWMKKRLINLSVHAIPVVAFFTLLSSCSSSPVPIKLGEDACAFCKMTLTDARFGAELITEKGRILTFDDMHCLQSYQKTHPENGASTVWLCVFDEPGQLVQAGSAQLLSSPELRSPMGGNVSAFRTDEAAEKAEKQYPGTRYTWQTLPR